MTKAKADARALADAEGAKVQSGKKAVRDFVMPTFINKFDQRFLFERSVKDKVFQRK